jgi:hypothetical protein
VLIAPTLVVTARHCVANLTLGDVLCTPAGDLALNSPGGQLGADDAASQIGVFTSDHVTEALMSDAPDAPAIQVLSTESPSTCRDDLAFVVLGNTLPGITPVPIRLTSGTEVGESISIWGYGLTDEAGAAPALRLRTGVDIVGIGPDQPTTLTQAAPVRAIRVGPGSITCNGDSGGPIVSATTGAVIGVVSFGLEAGINAACADANTDDTTGPRLAEYPTLALAAFAAAGAAPLLEVVPSAAADAAADPDGTAALDGAGSDSDPPTDPPPTTASATGGCAIAHEGHGPRGAAASSVIAIAMAGAAMGRRRR